MSNIEKEIDILRMISRQPVTHQYPRIADIDDAVLVEILDGAGGLSPDGFEGMKVHIGYYRISPPQI